MDTQTRPETLHTVIHSAGILFLLFTLVYGAAGWFTILLCGGVIIVSELLYGFKNKCWFNPYSLMLLSPLLLIKYSSIMDFRIRVIGFLLLAYVFNIALTTGKRAFTFSLADAPPLTVWFTAFLIFAIVSGFLYVQGIHLSGDEPHYIMISQSITDDGDFDLKNNFDEKTYYDYLPIDLRFHGGKHRGKYLSFHLPGVSFLLIPFYWLFKLLNGAIPAPLFFRLAASVINAFFAMFLFYLLRLKFPDKEITGFWLFILCIFPVVFHGVHLYPELPGAALMIAAYLSVSGKKLNGKHYFLAGLCLALVPWFHVKYIPPLCILALAIIYKLFKEEKGFNISKTKVLRLAAFFAIPVLSLALLVLYSKILYGSYSPTNIFPKESYWSVPWLLRLKVFLSYFLDQRDGLIFYSPLFFMAFLGFKKRLKGRGLLAAIAFAYIFFHAFTTVRGAYSPAGRPLMFISWVLALFLAHVYFNVLENKFTFRLLAGLSVFVLTWLFYYPLFVYQPVFSHTVERASGLNLFLGGDFMPTWNLFPSFITNPPSSHPANYVWIAALIIIIAVYYLRPFKLKAPLKIQYKITFAVLFITLASIFCLYPHVHLINRNKHLGKTISFYNNSKNFKYNEAKNGFRIKAGNRYDIFIDGKMVHQETVSFHFSHTDTADVTLHNGPRLLFQSKGKKQESFSLKLSSLKSLAVGNKQVYHIGFDTSTEARNAFLWLIIN